MTKTFFSLVKRFAREERGASMVEYAVLVGLLTAVLVTALAAVSDSVTDAFNNVAGVIDTSTTGAGGTPD